MRMIPFISHMINFLIFTWIKFLRSNFSNRQYCRLTKKTLIIRKTKKIPLQQTVLPVILFPILSNYIKSHHWIIYWSQIARNTHTYRSLATNVIRVSSSDWYKQYNSFHERYCFIVDIIFVSKWSLRRFSTVSQACTLYFCTFPTVYDFYPKISHGNEIDKCYIQ